MRKIIGLILIVAVAGMLVGCESTTPEIKSTFPQPEGLSIRGVVYGTRLDQSSGEYGDPLAGAVVTLNGYSQTWTTTSDANGEYSFTGIPQSSYDEGYQITVTKDGYQRKIETDVYLDSAGNVLPDNSVAVVDIVLNGEPVVLNVSPEPGTVVGDAAQTVTVEFNEAMDQSSVRPTITTMGIRSYAIADTETLTTSWSADSKILYITTGDLLSNQTYRLQVDPDDVAKDQAGYLMDTSGGTSGNAGGLPDDVYNATSSEYYYRTDSGGVPGAPSGLHLSVNAKTDIDYLDVVTASNLVLLNWLDPTSGNISGYRIYVATSTTGAWSLLGEAPGLAFGSTVGDVNTALYGSTYSVGIGTLAFVTDTVFFKVVAFNGEGEGAGVIVEERDSVDPLAVATRTTVIPGYTDYTAAPNVDLGCYITFTEPMDLSLLEDEGNYSVDTAGVDVDSATVIVHAPLTIVELTFDGVAPLNDHVDVPSGAEDLSGNNVDSGYITLTLP